MIAEPRCSTRACRHLVGVYQPHDDESVELPCCAAFAHGIPDEISYGDNDHTSPYPGDHGIQYEAGLEKAKAKPTKRLAPIPFDTPKNQRAIATYTRVLSQAFHTLGHSIANQLRTRAVGKAFNPDQPRDERGRWEGSGGESTASGDLVAYHGTAAAALESIRQNGLTVRGNTRNFDSSEYKGERGQSVYISNDLGEARGWPALGERPPQGAFMVLRVHIPEGEAGKLKPDEMRGDGSSWRYTANIPASWISGYQIQDPRTYKWSDWQSISKGEATHYIVILVDGAAAVGKADKTPEEILAEAMAIVEALDLSTLQVIVEDLTNEGIDVATDAGILAIAQFGMEDNASLVDHVNTRAVDFAKDRAAELIGMRYNAAGKLVPSANAEMRIDDSTRDMVRDSIVAGLQNGDRITEIADDLADLYAFSDERAALIANTEVRRAQSQGALEGYKETEKLGVEMFKIWLVADAPCEICEPNGEQGAIPLDDEFDSGDDAPPAHPSCRCVLAPVVDPDAFEPEINPEEDMGYRA